MSGLTRQQQLVLGVVTFLLVTGWLVRTWRVTHPPTPAAVAPAR